MHKWYKKPHKWLHLGYITALFLSLTGAVRHEAARYWVRGLKKFTSAFWHLQSIALPLPPLHRRGTRRPH